MKKSSLIAMAMVCGGLALLLASCGKSTPKPSPEKTSPSAASANHDESQNTESAQQSAAGGEFAAIPAELVARRDAALAAKDPKALVALGKEVRAMLDAKNANALPSAATDYKRFAATLFADAARLGSAEGMLLAARCAADGDGMERDLEKAFDLYLSAGEAGEAAGYTAAARILISGKDGQPDVAGAMALVDKAVAMGSADAKFLKGTLLLAQNGGATSDEAMSLLMDAAQADNADAQRLLAQLYQEGKYVPKDDKAYAEWMKLAADLGLATANADYAELSVFGTNGTTAASVRESMDRLTYAANQGDTEAAYSLTRLYLTGTVTREDVDTAQRYATQAFENGKSDAALQLAAIAMNESKMDDALAWLKKGADAGDWHTEYAYNLVTKNGVSVHDAIVTAAKATQGDAIQYKMEQSNADAATEMGTDSVPIPISLKEPDMPASLTAVGTQSTVAVSFTVDENGVPTDVQIDEGNGSPYAELNKAAIDAVSQWRFKPATKNGVPVKMLMRAPIEFQTHR